MSAIDDLKLTEHNMTKQVNNKRKEIDELKAEAENMKKRSEELLQQAKDEEKRVALLLVEMGAMRKNAEAAAAAEKRFNEKV